MTTPHDPGVYISSSQMYQEMRSLHDALTRVETKIDSFSNDAKSLADKHADHESRIRALEQTVWRAAGGAAVLGAGAGIVAQFLMR
jgi:predicted  nucleic acid-binding Zn-ribbon protein